MTGPSAPVTPSPNAGRPAQTMRVVIAQGSTSRVIEGPFCLCASRKDIELFRRCLDWWLEDEGKSYGWVSIVADPFSEIASDNPPQPWRQS
jgi:hypothetical protein